MKKYDIEFVPVSSLVMYGKNAKKHSDEQVERITNSIREFGFRQNLVIDKNNVVIIGNGRLLAVRTLIADFCPKCGRFLSHQFKWADEAD